ncbi:MAG: hypothetical protein RX316_10185 [bacterium]|nr:hypothetical protein [bacterium]
MDILNKGMEQKILRDWKSVEEVISRVVEDPSVMEDLAENVADYLSDVLKDDRAFRQRVIDVATANQDFKKRVMKGLVDEIIDA